MNKHLPFLLIVLLISGCGNQPPPAIITPTASAGPAESEISPSATHPSQTPPGPSPTPEPKTTASPLPSSPTPIAPEPDPTLQAAWQDIEFALAAKIMDNALERSPVLCEWAYLGRDNLEIYLYIDCMATVPISEESSYLPSADMPAVVRLDPQGNIQEVEIPGAGTLYAEDIQRLFPLPIQNRIFEGLIDYGKLQDYLDWRLDHPDHPPLSITAGTPQP